MSVIDLDVLAKELAGKDCVTLTIQIKTDKAAENLWRWLYAKDYTPIENIELTGISWDSVALQRDQFLVDINEVFLKHNITSGTPAPAVTGKEGRTIND